MELFIGSVLLGFALSMDAFSVSIANGLAECDMSDLKRIGIALCYALFQFIMPIIGWLCVRLLINVFSVIEPFIPWIAFVLLLYIGGKMIYESISAKNEDEVFKPLSLGGIVIQGIATSIDALSVGFTIDDYTCIEALLCAIIIAVVTFIICIVGLRLGMVFAGRLSGRAEILGGVILIFIGIRCIFT